jgi:hypothetical protein
MSQERLFAIKQEQDTSDDHYTPAWIFETLDLTFDLDVAAPPGGIPWIPARRYYTMEDDGLAQPWNGLVWMNPPYSNATPWVNRFLEHGNGVALLPICKGWWIKSLWSHPDTSCLIGMSPGKDRMTFHHKGKMKEIMFHVMFWAMGDEAIEALHKLGRVR